MEWNSVPATFFQVCGTKAPVMINKGLSIIKRSQSVPATAAINTTCPGFCRD